MGDLDSHYSDDADEQEINNDIARPTSAVEKQRQYTDHMQQVLEKKQLFESFYEHLPFERVLQMSHSSRKAEGVERDTTFGYGDIEYEAYAELILSLPVDYDVDLNELPNFVDLGSGCGRILFTALCLDVFDRVTGIEILPELHKATISAYRRYQRSDYDPDAAAELSFIHADATFYDWSENDFVFSHCSAFDDRMMRRICSTAEKLRPGALIITLTHRLPDESVFDLLGTKRVVTNWGEATAFIYRRNNEHTAEGLDDPMLHLEIVLNRHYPGCY